MEAHQMIKHLKIKYKLFLLTVLMIIGILAVGTVGYFSVNEINDDLIMNLTSADQAQETINTARSAQVHFKVQVQEWKNILLRGNNEENYNNYLKAFEAEEKTVQYELAKLKALMKSQGLPTDDVDRTIEVHADLGEYYRAALKMYDVNNPQSYQLVDEYVKGKDRAPTDAIDGIVEQIDSYSNQLSAQAKKDSMAQMDKVGKKLMIADIVSFTIIFMLALIVSRQIIRPLNKLKQELTSLAENGGDLTQKINTQSKDEMGDLAQAFNKFIANLRSIMIDVNNGGNDVEETASQLTNNSRQVASGANENAAAMAEIATTVEQVSANIQEIATAAQLTENRAADGAKQLNSFNEQFRKNNDIVGEVANTINNLNEKSKQISQIVNFITQIAEQTNLLALNAAIEAARAGEHGRGFAVVADEVRKLAEESAQATKEIGDIIKGIQGEADKAATEVDIAGSLVGEINNSIVHLGEAFNEIEGKVKGLASQIEDIAAASEQMSAGVQNVAATTEQQTASMQEVSAYAESLANTSNDLKSLIGKFKI
jgi:methyl-accepting chemotaxis protein